MQVAVYPGLLQNGKKSSSLCVTNTVLETAGNFEVCYTLMVLERARESEGGRAHLVSGVAFTYQYGQHQPLFEATCWCTTSGDKMT